jgi:hypothetical protein
MPTVISVTQGQDAGREFAVPRTTIRIGTEAYADIRLTDPQLQGVLTVVWKNGTWVITNGLGYPIYLDGQPFPRGETRVWFDGKPLQPTATTSLLLETRESGTAADEPGSVQELTPPVPEIAEWVRYAQCIGVIAGLVILLAISSGSPPMVDEKKVDQNYLKTISELNANHVGGYSVRFRSDWQMLTENLQQARHADKAADNEMALNLYEKCSQLYRVLQQSIDEQKQRDPNEDLDSKTEALMMVSEFINQRKGHLK